MSWLRHWKVILALVALFLIGGVTGTAVTLKVVKQIVANRSNPERVPQLMLHEYERRLDLTPEQVEKIRPIMQRTGREMWELRAEMTGRTFQIIRHSNEQIAAELTPEQQKRFEELKTELRERYRQQGPPGIFPKGPFQKGPGPFAPLAPKGDPKSLKEGDK